jgi:hypothetical protein
MGWHVSISRSLAAGIAVAIMRFQVVAQGEPPEHCFPNEAHPCCIALYESAAFQLGVPEVVSDTTVSEIINSGELDNCADEELCLQCLPPPPMNKDLSLGKHVVLSSSATISSEIQIGTQDYLTVLGTLGSALGVEIGVELTDEARCGFSAPGCTVRRGQLTRFKKTKTVVMNHSWSIAGVWASDIANHFCSVNSCPIAGGPWLNQSCSVGDSFATMTHNHYVCKSWTVRFCMMICWM